MFAIFMFVGPLIARGDVVTVTVEPGENADVYFQINLEGRVFVAADVDGEPACLDYWWITWPLGRVVELGRHCGRAAFDLPGFGDLAVASKLRAGGSEHRTRIQGTSSEKVARNFVDLSF